MRCCISWRLLGFVALLAEGVDRNGTANRRYTGICKVALLAEGVDRNTAANDNVAKRMVALLAEGVDRNTEHGYIMGLAVASPSSRRAWIEI